MAITEGVGSADAASHTASLHRRVGVTVALLATCMGVCKVKDDTIVRGMQQAHADKFDHWFYRQARNVRDRFASATAVQRKADGAGASGVRTKHRCRCRENTRRSKRTRK